jgi:hypothetical protein
MLLRTIAAAQPMALKKGYNWPRSVVDAWDRAPSLQHTLDCRKVSAKPRGMEYHH